ncbi:MAG: hypothetical protein GXO10_04410 [Crenarchaeota archaeon]|nr:hypothetical protein [Thermoproteota archaeon]
MRDYKFEGRRHTEEGAEDLSREIAHALSRMKKHKANGTTVEEVVSAIREVENMLRTFETDERSIIAELSKLSIDELRKRRDLLITQTRYLLRDLYALSSKISRNIKIIRVLNKILEKKILEKQSSGKF